MSKNQGFTLLEMMIVIAIAALLMTLAVPGLRGFLLGGARGDSAAALYGALVRARAEAIGRNSATMLCTRNYASSSGHARCDSASSASWGNGWVLYRDSAPNSTATKPVLATDVIATGEPTDRSLVWQTDPANTIAVQFESSGRLSSSTRIIWRLCKRGDSQWEGRRVQVDTSGRIRLARDTGCSA